MAESHDNNKEIRRKYTAYLIIMSGYIYFLFVFCLWQFFFWGSPEMHIFSLRLLNAILVLSPVILCIYFLLNHLVAAKTLPKKLIHRMEIKLVQGIILMAIIWILYVDLL